MLLHPDINSSITAEDEFIELKLAYEYLSSPRRKIIPKAVKKKASYKSKKRAYNRQYTKQEQFKKKTKGKRTHKKEIEHFDWYAFLRDMIRLGKGMLLFSICSSAAVALFTCFSGTRAMLNSIFVINMFFGVFCILIFSIFFLSYIPDMLKSSTSKTRQREKK